MTLRVVDLSSAPEPDVAAPPGVIVAHGSPHSEYWLDTATFTLSEHRCDDPRVVTVDSVPRVLSELTQRCQQWPIASAVCDDVLRSLDPAGVTLGGLVTESLAYSTLQAGPEFARWLSQRGPARVPDSAEPVTVQRYDDILRISFNRPDRHNAFCTGTRAALLEALAVAQLDPSIAGIVLGGNGPSFCSGETSPSSAPSPTRPAPTWRAPGTVLPWCSTNSPAGSAGPVALRCTGGCWAAGWRWPHSAGGCRRRRTPYSDCPS